MNIIEWIRSADPSLEYLADRDLCNTHNDSAFRSIGKTGWCADYIKNRNPDGGWGRRFCQPKWICTHYTLLELRNLEYPAADDLVLHEINRIGMNETASDGGYNCNFNQTGAVHSSLHTSAAGFERVR